MSRKTAFHLTLAALLFTSALIFLFYSANKVKQDLGQESRQKILSFTEKVNSDCFGTCKFNDSICYGACDSFSCGVNEGLKKIKNKELASLKLRGPADLTWLSSLAPFLSFEERFEIDETCEIARYESLLQGATEYNLTPEQAEKLRILMERTR